MTEREHDHPRRRYQSAVRDEQAQLTRQRIARAARLLFLEHGFARTSLRQVAASAGVAEQTIYSTYGNKRGLMLAIIDDADFQAGIDQALVALTEAEGDAARQLAVFVAFDRRLFEQGGDLLRILRDAGVTDPDLARGYLEGRERSRQSHLRTMTQWREHGDLRHDLTEGEAADLYHAISNIDSYSYLVNERGWSPDDWEQHTYRVLVAALLRVDR